MKIAEELRAHRTEADMAGVGEMLPYDLGRYVGGMDGSAEQLLAFAGVLAEALHLTGDDHVRFVGGLQETLCVTSGPTF